MLTSSRHAFFEIAVSSIIFVTGTECSYSLSIFSTALSFTMAGFNVIAVFLNLRPKKVI